MIFTGLRLQSFRNYDSTEINFAPGANYFAGANGHGKTNLLESIYLFGLARSFRTAHESDMVKADAASYECHATLKSPVSVSHNVSIIYQHRKKTISIDRKKIQSYARLVGLIPMVLFSPEDHKITSGSPADRRRFLNILLSQADKKYLQNLQEYTRILRHRNKLLELIQINKARRHELVAWDAALAHPALNLYAARHNFLKETSSRLGRVYTEISDNRDNLTAEYCFSKNEKITDTETFCEVLAKYREQDIIRRQTSIGPHRDDLRFLLAGMAVKNHASRGEQKSALLALKIAEYHYLKKIQTKTPVLLCDDIYSELDDKRQQNVIAQITSVGQSFITTTHHTFPLTPDDAFFAIKDGNIEEDRCSK